MKSQLRGHKIIFVNGMWIYADTKTPSAGNERDCGHCGKRNSIEGHDGCLGTLPDVMNACCGHGEEQEAYIQYWDGCRIDGKDALNLMSNEE